MVGYSVFVSFYESCLADSGGFVHLVSSTPLAPTNLLPPLLQASLNSALCLGMSLSIYFHLLLEEASLRAIGLGTNL